MSRKSMVLMVALTLIVGVKTSKGTIQDRPGSKIFLGVVVDAGPGSDRQWSIRKSRTVELISALQTSDKVVVVKARNGKPVVQGRAVVGETEKTGLNEIISKVSVMGKELLFQADIARAAETVSDLFQTEGQDYHCCLIVLTTGKMSDSQVQKIVQLASNMKDSNSSVCITYEPAKVNDDLVRAGKQGYFNIRLVSNPGLGHWVQTVKESIAPKVEAQIIDLNDGVDEELTQEAPEPIIDIPESNLISDVNVVCEPCEPNLAVNVVQQAKGRFHPFVILKIFLVPAVLFITLALVGTWLHKKDSPKSIIESMQDYDHTDDPIVHLKALVGDEDIDLGPLDSITEFSIGSDPVCGIYIEDEEVQGRHARIFASRKGLKIQNINSTPIVVDGMPVKSGRRQLLNLPAEVKLTSSVEISLFNEEIEIQGKDNSNEKVN